MFELRASKDRGHADHGWLKSYHSFSFADYVDRQHVEFGALRVINEDYVAPGTGFGMHPHRDMEIVTYVLEGELEHQDSMGNGSVIRPGDVQRMSAGTGILHSEKNPSADSRAHLLQIWIRPNRLGIEPSYEQRYFAAAEKRGRLRLVASPDGANNSVRIQQDARIFAGLFSGNESASLALAPERLAYVHIARGAISVNGKRLTAGDAIKISEVATLDLANGEQSEILVFDLPGANAKA
jgi:quercetin 2,3-dioxygenase